MRTNLIIGFLVLSLLIVIGLQIILNHFIFQHYHLDPVSDGAPIGLTLGKITPKAGPMDIYPLAYLTPGKTNPDVVQSNINQTICKSGWTATIRPPTSYTNQLKVKQIKLYGDHDTKLQDYEEDHFISLELGGSPTDPLNLWPEPYAASVADGGARNKDRIENALHAAVCNGSLTLAEAQTIITTDWYNHRQVGAKFGGVNSDLDSDDE